MTSTIFLGIVSIALALIFRAQTASFPHVAQRLPILLIWLVIVLAVLMIAEDVYKRRSARRTAPGPLSEAPAAINWPVMLAFSAAIVVYAVLIPIAGYLVATPLFVGGTLVAGRNMRTSTAILIAVGTSAFMWAVFVWALNLPVKLLPFMN